MVSFYDPGIDCLIWQRFTALRLCEWPDARPQMHELRNAVADLWCADPTNVAWMPNARPPESVSRVVRALDAMDAVTFAGDHGVPITYDAVMARAKAVGAMATDRPFVLAGVWSALDEALKQLEPLSTDDSKLPLLRANLAIDAAVDLPLAFSRSSIARLERVVRWRWPQEARNESVILERMVAEHRAAVLSGKVLRAEHLEMMQGLASELEANYRPCRMACLPVTPEALMSILQVPEGVRLVNVSFDPMHHAFMLAVEGDELPVDPVPCTDRLPLLSPEYTRNQDGSIACVGFGGAL